MCYQPITIKTPQGYRQVPCGKCLECLRKYQSDWSNRMYEELKAHDGKAVFFTLTYDDNNVPKNYLYYASATDYEIFRSPSDYGYDNTYTDEKGRTKVLPSRKGERKHFRVDPDVELRATGLDPKIIDFNVQRKEHEKFRDTIQNIYGNYLRTIICSSDVPEDIGIYSSDSIDGVFDFDAYDGDYYSTDKDCEEGTQLVLDLFTEALNDDDYEEDKGHEDKVLDIPYVVRTEEAYGTHFRERPVMMFNSVRKKDVQDWIKRARQRRKRISQKTGEPEQAFTFYITSEYGPRTLRPHYHGVLFGVTAKETMDMMVDWQRHHGKRISWDDVDLSKGDMSYCAKYCSKGFYEHPLCSRDFFYYKPTTCDDTKIRPFTEYHSKHYERCIEIFGIDTPIVDPTFHLVSKGLGVDWVANNAKMVEDFQDIDFKDTDTTAEIKVAYTPTHDYKYYEALNEWNELPLPWEDGYEDHKERIEQLEDIVYDLSIIKDIEDEEEHIIHRQNKEVKSKDYAECIERLFNKFKYYRTYKDQVIPYGVPKYYRTKIFSDGLRAAFANYVQQVNVELYKDKFEQLRAEDPTREDSEIVLMLERQDQAEKYRRMSDCKKRLDKLYNKSKI